MLKKLINRYIPMGLLPRRYNTEQQLRWVFEKLSGRTVEKAFELCEVDKKYIKVCFDVLDERFGERIASGDHAEFVDATTEAVSVITEFIVPQRQG